MPAPLFGAPGTAQAAISGITLSWPTHAVNDIGFLIVETSGNGTDLGTISGWTQAYAPFSDVADATGSRLFVYWRRATSSAEANVAIPDNGDHQIGRIVTFSGCIVSGDPWNAITGVFFNSTNTVVLPSLTATVEDTLFVAIVTRPNDNASTTHFGSLVNANLTDIGSAGEAGSTIGNGGGFTVEYGTFAGPGATGNSTISKIASTTGCAVYFLLQGPRAIKAGIGAFNEQGQDAGLIYTQAAQTLAADPGAFNETGQAAGLLVGRSVTADAGSFNEVGQDAGLTRAHRLVADPGAFNETGQDAGLVYTQAARSLAADPGAFNETGQDAGLLTGRRVIADPGAFNETGQAAALSRTIRLIADAGAFNETGQDAGLSRGLRSTADLVAFALTGQDAALQRGRSLVGDAGAFTLTGQAAGLPRTYSLAADAGTFSEQGQAAGLVRAIRSTADPGAFAFTGQAVNLLKALPVIGGVGQFILAGQPVNFPRTYSLAADPAAFNEQGQDAGLARSIRSTADAGAYTFTGQAANLPRGRAVPGDAGAFTLTGQAAGLARGYSLQAEVAALNEQGQNAGLSRSWIMPAAVAAFTLTGEAAATLWTRPITAGLGSFALAGQAVNWARSYLLSANTGALLEEGQDATLSRTRRLLADTRSLLVSGVAADFRRQTIIPTWSASATVAASSLRRPTTATGNGLVYRAIVGGVTGATEPVWPTTFGGTVTDGTVTWRAVSRITGDFQTLEPSSIIELFELQLNTKQHGSSAIYRFHAGANANNNGEVVWAGNAYQRLPVEADGFEYGGQGQLPRPKIRVSNILGTITEVLTTLPGGLERAKVTRIRTLARYIDAINFPSGNPFGIPDATAEFPREIYYIDRKIIENRDVVEFELAAAFDLQGVRAPKRQCVANICPWEYRVSAECGYTDSIYYTADDVATTDPGLDVCGKRLSSCEARFSPFVRTGTTTVGSTTLTVSSTAGIQAGASGYPVAGFGIPAGTKVNSITSSTTLVMSAAATASTSVVVNGTASATAKTMTVTSATGLAIGQSVSGTYIPSGTTISAISGTTITLSERPRSIARTATVVSVTSELVLEISTSELSNGMRVFGSNDISGTITAIDGSTITVNSIGNLDFDSIGREVRLFFMPATPSQSSYTFTAASEYTFRSTTAGLPFGSFPGIGTYFA